MSRKMLAAIGTAPAGVDRRRRLKSKIVNAPKIRQPGYGVDDVRLRDRDEDQNDSEDDQPSSAQNSVRAHEDRSRRVA